MIARAQMPVTAYGGTILPFKDDTLGFYSVETERKGRGGQQPPGGSGPAASTTAWSTSTSEMGDTGRNAPIGAMKPAPTAGNHLHPNDAAVVAMAATQ